MGKETEIAWTDATFNPWWGCVRVSPGCTHCYAESFAKRTGNAVWGVQAPRRFFGEKHWGEPLKWNRAAETAGVRKRVFCASMADVFEDREDLDPWRQTLWALIDRTPWLDWQLLTKRPENIVKLSPAKLPNNIWLGTTAEDQEYYDLRWPLLADAAGTTGVATTFISYEPALGPLELKCRFCGGSAYEHIDEADPGRGECTSWFPSWVIAGGESGGGARDFDLRWAISLREQCLRAGVAYFFKQAGAKPVDSSNSFHRLKLVDQKGGDLSELPGFLRVREFPALGERS